MITKILFCIIVVVSAFFTTTPLAKAAPSDNALTVIGDSISLRSQADIKTALPNASVDGVVGRQWSAGVPILQQVKNSGQLKPTIAFLLGTNGPITQADIQSVLSITSGSQIIFMTQFGARSWINANNQLINAAAKTNSSIKILDWGGAATADPTLVGPDGIHPTTAGTKKFAELLAAATNSSNSQPSTTPAQQSARNTPNNRAEKDYYPEANLLIFIIPLGILFLTIFFS